jgi:hypothetical protein
MVKHRLDHLVTGVRLLLNEDGYAFSDADKALLEEILEELEEMSKSENGANQIRIFEILSLVIRYLRFFGIDDVSDLF